MLLWLMNIGFAGGGAVVAGGVQAGQRYRYGYRQQWIHLVLGFFGG